MRGAGAVARSLSYPAVPRSSTEAVFVPTMTAAAPESVRTAGLSEQRPGPELPAKWELLSIDDGSCGADSTLSPSDRDDRYPLVSARANLLSAKIEGPSRVMLRHFPRNEPANSIAAIEVVPVVADGSGAANRKLLRHCSVTAESEAQRATNPCCETEFTVPRTSAHIPRLASGCFPPASPVFGPGSGKQKTATQDRSNRSISLRKFGAGEGIRTLDPNLGKVGNCDGAGGRNRTDTPLGTGF